MAVTAIDSFGHSNFAVEEGFPSVSFRAQQTAKQKLALKNLARIALVVHRSPRYLSFLLRLERFSLNASPTCQGEQVTLGRKKYEQKNSEIRQNLNGS